jgi:hypothetical protein
MQGLALLAGACEPASLRSLHALRALFASTLLTLPSAPGRRLTLRWACAGPALALPRRLTLAGYTPPTPSWSGSFRSSGSSGSLALLPAPRPPRTQPSNQHTQHPAPSTQLPAPSNQHTLHTQHPASTALDPTASFWQAPTFHGPRLDPVHNPHPSQHKQIHGPKPRVPARGTGVPRIMTA